ncbi:MAG: phage holin family protein [Clostridia bacterium]|nr:phage holin family protein [Clostridia bacterium]
MNGQKKISGLGMIGLIFTLIGASFCIIGIAVFLFVKVDEAAILGLIYTPIGAVFLVLGLLFLFLQRRKEKMHKQVREAGHYIMATVDRVICNTNLTYNNMHPYIVYCNYVDERGVMHHFKSRNVMFNPTGMFRDNQVKVFVESKNLKYYDVDIDSILPNTVIHTVNGYQSKNKGVFLCGVIFTIMGSVFAGIGLAISLLAVSYPDRWMFFLIFGGIGGIFLVIGIIFLARELRKKSQVKRLKNSGDYVNAVIKSVAVDSSIEYGGMAGTSALYKNLSASGSHEQVYTSHPLYFQCSYAAPDGIEHIFRSESKVGLDQERYIGQNVKVYYKGDDFRKYYVALEEVHTFL